MSLVATYCANTTSRASAERKALSSLACAASVSANRVGQAFQIWQKFWDGVASCDVPSNEGNMRKKSKRKGMKVGSGTGSEFQEVKRVVRGQKGEPKKKALPPWSAVRDQLK